MDFVNEDHFAVQLAELILCINEDKTFFSSHFSAALKELACVVLHNGIILCAHNATRNNLLLGNILVVPFIRLSCRSNDGFGELLVLFHAFGKRHSADRTHSSLVVTPRAAGEIAADNHLYLETISLVAHCNHWVRSRKAPVRNDVFCSFEEICSNLVEYLPFIRNTFGEDNIESGDSVSSYHDKDFIVDIVHITHFAVIYACLVGEFVVGFD